MPLFSYKMTHDTGFAPNPFGFTLTLATCKPQIRRAKKVGDWLAGFTSKTLNGDRVGEERLIYLMRVGEKLHLRDYYDDARFQDKIPNASDNSPASRFGDNIYRPLVPGAVEPAHFEQLPNPHHWDLGQNTCSQHHLQDDVFGQYVLIADEFYYFGAEAIALPDSVRPALMAGQSGHGRRSDDELANRFITHIRSRNKPGRQGDVTQKVKTATACGDC